MGKANGVKTSLTIDVDIGVPIKPNL